MRAAQVILKKKRLASQFGFVRWRFILLFSCVALALGILVTQLAWLQLINPDQLIREGDKRTLRTQMVPTMRGIISDRNGRPLAVSVPSYSICANPQKINLSEIKGDAHWLALANALSMPLDQLYVRLESNSKSSFIYLSRQASPEVADYIRALKLPGICWEQGSRRFYPAGATTAHLIGFTNIDSQGIEGIEYSFDDLLTGRPGARTVRKDRVGRVIEDVSSVDSQTPHNLTLSIDERLQTLVYQELSKAVELNKAEAGTAVLIDIHTGEVLAMVNSPSYNPNNRQGVKKETMRNRAITDMFEPGSTVKPLVIMTGLEQKVINENTVIRTQGPFKVNDKEIKDVAPRAELTIAGIIQKSSNIGVSKIALQMPPDVLVKTYQDFGFGLSPNIGLSGEARGTLPVNKKRWADIERATLSYGYGLMTSPLQLARAYATIGSGGVMRPLSITRVDPPVIGERVMPEETVRKVIGMMEMVTAPGEGGSRAAVKGYRVAVKTGTAKKVGANGGYVDKYLAYTAGIAPVSNPRFALVIVIDTPSAGRFYGGAVSAPVFGSVMSGVLRMMNIKPDAINADTGSIVIKRNEV